MAKVIGATEHGNRHKVVDTYYDVIFVTDLLLLEKVFKKKRGRGSGDNEESIYTDLYQVGIATLASGVPLHNYISCAQANWKKSRDPGAGEAEQALFDVFDLVGNELDQENTNEEAVL